MGSKNDGHIVVIVLFFVAFVSGVAALIGATVCLLAPFDPIMVAALTVPFVVKFIQAIIALAWIERLNEEWPPETSNLFPSHRS